jgi:hypothetical protein
MEVRLISSHDRRCQSRESNNVSSPILHKKLVLSNHSQIKLIKSKKQQAGLVEEIER